MANQAFNSFLLRQFVGDNTNKGGKHIHAKTQSLQRLIINAHFLCELCVFA